MLKVKTHGEREREREEDSRLVGIGFIRHLDAQAIVLLYDQEPIGCWDDSGHHCHP